MNTGKSVALKFAWLIAHRNYDGVACLQWPFSRRPDGYGHRFGRRHDRDYPHRLMCEIAHGPAPSPSYEVAHSCGNGHFACVHQEHIRWATRKENAEDQIQHGTNPAGARHPMAKLTDAQVAAIRSSAEKGITLAVQYGVNRSAISRIRSMQRWK